MLFCLMNLEMGKISFIFESGYIIFMGVGKITPSVEHFRVLYTIYTFFILLYCRIHLKGNTLNRKQWVNVKHVFLSIKLSLI